MAFDPDAYLAGDKAAAPKPFDPDAYLKGDGPSEMPVRGLEDAPATPADTALPVLDEAPPADKVDWKRLPTWRRGTVAPIAPEPEKQGAFLRGFATGSLPFAKLETQLASLGDDPTAALERQARIDAALKRAALPEDAGLGEKIVQGLGQFAGNVAPTMAIGGLTGGAGLGPAAATAAGMVPGVALNVQESEQNAAERLGEAPMGSTIAAGIGKSALDVLPGGMVFSRMFGKPVARLVYKSLVRRIGESATKQALAETSTEIGQNLVDELNVVLNDPSKGRAAEQLVQEAVDTAIAVGPGSLLLGGASPARNTAASRGDARLGNELLDAASAVRTAAEEDARKATTVDGKPHSQNVETAPQAQEQAAIAPGLAVARQDEVPAAEPPQAEQAVEESEQEGPPPVMPSRFMEGVEPVPTEETAPSATPQPPASESTRPTPPPSPDIDAARAERKSRLQDRFQAVLDRLAHGAARQVELQVMTTDEAEAAAAAAGTKLSPTAVAAIIRQQDGKKAVVTLISDRLNGDIDHVEFLHEVAHAYWDALPEPVRRALEVLRVREQAARRGPLFGKDGQLAPGVSGRVLTDPQEWFAERMAWENKAWIEKRMADIDRGVVGRAWGGLRDFMGRTIRNLRGKDTFTGDEFRDFLAGRDTFSKKVKPLDSARESTRALPASVRFPVDHVEVADRYEKASKEADALDAKGDDPQSVWDAFYEWVDKEAMEPIGKAVSSGDIWWNTAVEKAIELQRATGLDGSSAEEQAIAYTEKALQKFDESPFLKDAERRSKEVLNSMGIRLSSLDWDLSKKSQSQYITANVTTDEATLLKMPPIFRDIADENDGKYSFPVKVRLSDHRLPDQYTAPNIDVSMSQYAGPVEAYKDIPNILNNWFKRKLSKNPSTDNIAASERAATTAQASVRYSSRTTAAPPPVPATAAEVAASLTAAERIPSAARRALSLGGLAWRSATDTLRRSGGRLADLADRIDGFFDDHAQLEAEMWQPFRAIRKKVGERTWREAMTQAGNYLLAREKAKQLAEARRPEAAADWRAEAARRLAAAGPTARAVLDAWERTTQTMAAVAERMGVKTMDPATGIYRAFKAKTDYWPRMMHRDVREVLADPNLDPKRYRELLDQLEAESGLSRERAAALLAEAGRYVAHVERLGNMEVARIGFLPQEWYDHRLEIVLPKYLSEWTRALARIKRFGQETGKTHDAFWHLLEPGSPNRLTQREALDYVDGIRTDLYGLRKRTLLDEIMAGLRAFMAVTKLSTVASAIRNLSQMTATTAILGPRASLYGAYRLLFRGAAEVARAKEAGALREDILYGWDVARDFSERQRKVQDVAMKASGFSGAETINRAHAAASARSFARWGIRAMQADPNGRAARIFRAKMARWGVDSERLALEGVDGSEMQKLARAATNVTQFSYDLRMTPLWANSPAAKFLFQFQKFSMQMARLFATEIVGPAIKGEVVNGKRVHQLGPLLLFLPLAMATGEGMRDLWRLLFGKERKDASWGEIAATAADGETARAAALALERAFNDVVFIGALGLIGDYAASLRSLWTDPVRAKGPWNLVGLSPFANFAQSVAVPAFQQKGLTGRDIWTWLSRELPILNYGTAAVVQAMRAAGSTDDAVRLAEQRNAIGLVRSAWGRFLSEKGVEAPTKQQMSRTPNTPFNRDLNEALMLGDVYTARSLIAGELEGLDPKAAKQRMTAIKASMNMRDPANFGSNSEMRPEFDKWLKRRRPELVAPFKNAVENYDRTAAKVGLRSGRAPAASIPGELLIESVTAR